jgi:hypothetical protein
MGYLVAALLIAATAQPIDDLHFNDAQLERIAGVLVQQARSHGIHTSAGRNRIERLLSLESQVGTSDLALNRVDKLVSDMTMTDATQWSKLRRSAAGTYARRDDAAARRVKDLLRRWQREQLEIISDYLSSNYSKPYIASLEWERRFHQFAARRPIDAATWGWLLLQSHRAEVMKQYGRADSEMAYRYYLEFSGLGDGREARLVFSVPGVEIR